MEKEKEKDQTIVKIVDFLTTKSTSSFDSTPGHVIYDALYEYVKSGRTGILEEYDRLWCLRDAMDAKEAWVVNMQNAEDYVRIINGNSTYYCIADWFTKKELEEMDNWLLKTLASGDYTVPYKDEQDDQQ
jgi:hypothetical protein